MEEQKRYQKDIANEGLDPWKGGKTEENCQYNPTPKTNDNTEVTVAAPR